MRLLGPSKSAGRCSFACRGGVLRSKFGIILRHQRQRARAISGKYEARKVCSLSFSVGGNGNARGMEG